MACFFVEAFRRNNFFNSSKECQDEKVSSFCNVLLNEVKDLNARVSVFEILRFAQNDKMQVFLKFDILLNLNSLTGKREFPNWETTVP